MNNKLKIQKPIKDELREVVLDAEELLEKLSKITKRLNRLDLQLGMEASTINSKFFQAISALMTLEESLVEIYPASCECCERDVESVLDDGICEKCRVEGDELRESDEADYRMAKCAR